MKNQRGATLIELAIFVAAALVLLGIGLTGWARVQDGTKSTRLINMVSSIDKAVHTRFPNTWNYAGLDVTSIADSLPGDIRPAGCAGKTCTESIRSPFGGDIVVGPSFPGGTYAITIGPPLTTEGCIDLVTQLGTQFWYVQRGTQMKAKSLAAIDPTIARTACANTTQSLRLTDT